VDSWLSDCRNASWYGLADCAPSWAVIADGMGGHDAGEIASESAVRTIMRLAKGAQSELDIAQMLEAANDLIYQQMYGDRGRLAMGTTVVGVVLREQAVLMFNVGDSRLFLTRGSELVLESVDDTLTGALPHQKVRSHALTQALGGSFRRIPFTPHIKGRILSGSEGLLLCSDGLTDMLSEEEIGSVLSPRPTHPAAALVSAALDAGGSDNITVVVVGTPV
jgi:PPM family protein phosphatase